MVFIVFSRDSWGFKPINTHNKQGLGISHTLVGVQPTIPWHMIRLQYPKTTLIVHPHLTAVCTRPLCLLAGKNEVLPWLLELSCHELKKLALYCVPGFVEIRRWGSSETLQLHQLRLVVEHPPLFTGFYTSERWLIGISERINSTKFGKLKVLMFCLDQPSW